MLNTKANVSVVCHDAGAANIIIAALKVTGRNDWRVCMQGPARDLWKFAFPGVPTYPTPEEAMENAELLISGTGWESNIEHNARCIARMRGVHSVVMLDHWVNYNERFVRSGNTVLPDEFWVTDKDAFRIAQKCFPDKPVIQVVNHYAQEQLKKIKLIEQPPSGELLYVLEPIRSNWGQSSSGEFQALDYFVSKFKQLNLPKDVIIRLRPHPSEPVGKYDEWLAKWPDLRLVFDTELEIYHSIGRATWVAGCESYALVLALLARRSVFCTLPPWAPPCCLPQKDLIHLARL